jgi:hypothetical protein
VTVQLSKDAVSGVARFTDPDYIATYDAWVDRENTRLRAAPDAAAWCAPSMIRQMTMQSCRAP